MATEIGRLGNILKDSLGSSSIPIKSGKFTRQNILYSNNPVPFVVPTLDGSTPWESLRYSAVTLEEIMYNLAEEVKSRGYSGLQFKRYFRVVEEVGSNRVEHDWITPKATGQRLISSPIKFFPQYCSDIMEVIEALVGDITVPDDLQQYQARIFANYTVVNRKIYNNNNKIRDAVIINKQDFQAGSSSRREYLHPVTNINNRLWAFDINYIKKCIPIIGVTPHGEAQVQNTPGGFEISDPNWPQSVIGKTTSSGVAGFEATMTRADGPFVDSATDDNIIMQIKQHVSNTSTGKGAGETDHDQAYSYLAHFPHVVEQMRYKPPKVEFFPAAVEVKHWETPIYSNTTPNLSWYFSQVLMKQWPQNLGAWLIKGYGGVGTNGLYLKTYAHPGVNTAGVCPYSVFRPTPTSTCTCVSIDTAYAIWYAYQSGFVWEGQQWWQISRASIPFGPHTRMRIIGTGGGDSDPINDLAGSQTYCAIGIRTERISSMVMSQPFYYLQEGSINCDIALQDTLADLIDHYEVGGIDHVLAIGIFLTSKNKVIEIRNAVDGPTGSYIPGTPPTCSCPTAEVYMSSVEFYEDQLRDPVSGYPDYEVAL